MLDKPDCAACRKLKRREPDSDECAQCLPPLMDENRDAMRVYMVTRGQMILAPMGGAVDINHLAVHEAMRLYRVADRKGCFERVLKLAHHFLEKEREESAK